MKSSLLTALSLVIALPLAAQAAAPAGMSAADRRQGALSHPEVMRGYGAAMSGPAADMLTRVGRRVAIASGLSQTGEDFTVTLLDSPEINAFATLGGYIYATRGLLALMNDEAELAAVLGHEVGHVAKRHVRMGQQRRTMSTIFAGAMRIVAGPQIGTLSGAAMYDLNLGFSRSDEFAADDLGVRYAAAAGYDPGAAADALHAMQRYEMDMNRFQLVKPGEQTSKGDHPDTAERVARARREAGKTGRSGQGQRERADYLAAIDGLPFGSQSDNGILDGRELKLPLYRIAFTVPAGVMMSTSDRGVTMTGPGSRAYFTEEWLEGPFSDAVNELFDRIGPVQRFATQSAILNGLEVRYAPGRAESEQGSIDIDVLVFRVPDQRRVYSLITQAPAGAGLGPFRAVVDSIRRMAPNEAADLRPLKLRIVTVQPGDTIEGLAARMAVGDEGLAQFLLLNDLDRQATLSPGTSVKLVKR